MKKRLLAMGSILLAFLLFWGIIALSTYQKEYQEEKIPRISTVCEGDPRMLIVDCGDGDYGVVLRDETQIKFKDDICEEAWEEGFSSCEDGKWRVLKEYNLYASVTLGEKAEKPANRDYDYTKGWYYADEITVERYEQRYRNRDEKMKPVIYLYPEAVTEVAVLLENDGELTCTYPAYNDGWKVTAQPDSILTDSSGQTYNYLYWEGESDVEYDFTKGFCVAGEDTAAFLEESLAQLGLTRKEANEFIVYWLPMMEKSNYNLIAFQTDVYTESAKLTITPEPDTMLRVFMAWKPLEEKVEIEPQTLAAPERTGFTVVEWGGSEIE